MNGIERAPTADAAGQSAQVPTVSKRLENEEKCLTERLEKIREIRAALVANPETQQLIDGLSSLGQFHY